MGAVVAFAAAMAKLPSASAAAVTAMPVIEVLARMESWP